MGQKNNLLRYTLIIVQFSAIRNERDQELWSYRQLRNISCKSAVKVQPSDFSVFHENQAQEKLKYLMQTWTIVHSLFQMQKSF